MHYELLAGESEIDITAHSSVHNTRARTTALQGGFDADLADGVPVGEVRGGARVAVASFKSGNRLLEMNTLRHVEARKHREASFEIGAVAPEADGRLRVSGTMTFHGVAVATEAVVDLEVDGDTVRVRGSWRLVQSDYGLRPPRLLMLKVDDGIDVEFTLVARAAG